jgi:NRAMP (natural resistance-associated macrophage protein)-like metal ion transporter
MKGKEKESIISKDEQEKKHIYWKKSWLPRLRGIGFFLAILGPGIITSSVDNDVGGITTYSLCGANFGLKMLWSLIPITICLMVVQEMCTRIGVVTGKGLSDLIRERFGIKFTFYLLIGILIGNLGTIIAEFAGVAASMEIVGLSKYMTVPLAGVLVWILVLKVNYKKVEKIFLVACSLYVAYIISAFLAHPDWNTVVISLVKPQIELNTSYLVMLTAVVGTTIAPWMQFYLQSSVVEKGVKIEYMKYSQMDTFVGSFIVNFIAFFIIVVCATTIFANGLKIETVKDAAIALTPLAGYYATLLFSFGLLNASLFAACILPITTAFLICEGFGWESGVDKKFTEAPQFYTLYSLSILFGVIFVLIPNIPLLNIIFISQVILGLSLPIVMVIMLILINDRKIMGKYANNVRNNIISYAIVSVVTIMTLAMIFFSIADLFK